jgi:Putative RNA methylase family UPF0020
MFAVTPESAPKHWALPATHVESRLHQLSPYIGKLKSTIALDLVQSYSSRGDSVLDPFCGSGTVPLEAALAGRTPLAFDANPYAVMLTRAKLNAPPSLEAALEQLHQRIGEAKRHTFTDLRTVPAWVRSFFHPETLKQALAFADVCIAAKDDFLLSCFMGILHHQRPGFLSYPSSHLVPYLRDKKYPRNCYPDMYAPRDVASRMTAKVTRAFKMPPAHRTGGDVECRAISALELDQRVDAIITSPPYMNALDYVRDNRLRMWFLDRETANYSREPTDDRSEFTRLVDGLAQRAIAQLRPGGACVLVVGETVRRKRITSHPAELIALRLSTTAPYLRLRRVIKDVIPDVRRTRHEGRATKQELVLVFERMHRATKRRA